MIAILYLVFFIVYISISIWAIRKGYQFAKVKYQRGWVGALAAAFIMYNLVFWDWIPVILMHKYYCETEAGFWEYKTPEQWLKEHPEVVGQDWSEYSSFRTEYIRKTYGNTLKRYWFGSSVYREVAQHSKIDLTKTIYKREDKVVDVKTGQILFKSTNFSRVAEYKLWLAEPSQSEGPGCSMSAKNGVGNEFEKLINLVKGGKK